MKRCNDKEIKKGLRDYAHLEGLTCMVAVSDDGSKYTLNQYDYEHGDKPELVNPTPHAEVGFSQHGPYVKILDESCNIRTLRGAMNKQGLKTSTINHLNLGSSIHEALRDVSEQAINLTYQVFSNEYHEISSVDSREDGCHPRTVVGKIKSNHDAVVVRSELPTDDIKDLHAENIYVGLARSPMLMIAEVLDKQFQVVYIGK